MSKKLQAIDNYLIITDTVDNTTIEFPMGGVHYKDYGNNIKFLSSVNSSHDVSFLKSELVDADGVAFTDEELLAFLRTNTGFNLASASGARETLKHFVFNPDTNKLEADRAIETTLNSLFLGEQHKMSSGAENIFFTNLGSDINFYPMWGGLKDQSVTANQGASGFIPPSGRIYTDLSSTTLGGQPDNTTSIGYSGDNYFGVNIAGLGITTVSAEQVNLDVRLEYRLYVNGKQVYMQQLPKDSIIYPNDQIEWFFDHPVEIHAGTTIFAEIVKVRNIDDTDLGVFQVRMGDDGTNRYHAIVHNRLFEDKDLELISPYLKYESMDFGLDSTGSSIFMRDLSLGSESLLVSHDINTLQATANGSNIQIKVKGGQKVIIESLPISNASIDGYSVNSVLNQAILQLNNIFTNTSGFSSGGNPVTNLALSGNTLTLTLQDNTSYSVDVTTLGVDENKFVSSGALSGSNLELTMSDSSVITIDASNMINGSQLPARTNDWFIAYGNSTGDEVTVPTVVNSLKGKQPFYNGSALGKGEEFIWTHDNSGTYILGLYSGAEENSDETEIMSDSKWSTNFKFSASNNNVRETSVGVDVASRYTSGYTISNSTLLALRYGEDNYLHLYDISNNGSILIGKSNTALVGNSQMISMGGDNQPNAKFPVMTKRYSEWNIVHDEDNSENGEWMDGVDDHTILKSTYPIFQGEKFMINITTQGRTHSLGLGFPYGTSGVNGAEDLVTQQFRFTSSEILRNWDNEDWVFNTSSTYYYNNSGAGSYGAYFIGNGIPVGMLSIRYISNNQIELWSETYNEKIAHLNSTWLGTEIYLYFGAEENASDLYIPNISRQDITQGSQPVTTFAPDVSDQVIEITEGASFNSFITLDNNSDIVNIYGESNAPAWSVLNQSTGEFTGTAPAYTGSFDDYVINCKAANALGGITSFDVTLRVLEITYTNTKSLEFEDGVNSYLGGNASLVTSLERSGNGSGTSDAWSVGMWIKRGTSSSGQSLFYYGHNDITNNGHIEIRLISNGRIRLKYGSNNNQIQVQTGTVSAIDTNWNHVLVTYDGGTTGASSGSLSSYYGRFKIFVNGVLASVTNSHQNYGWSGSIVGQNFRFGKYVSGNYPKDLLLNQLAIWNTNQSANISNIYNSGNTQDLSLLSDTPEHYYEIETSTTTIQDLNSTAHLVGYNFSSSDLVTDTP